MVRRGKVEVSAGFLLTVAALFYFDTENVLPWAMLACTLHELGHCVAVHVLGGRMLAFRLTAVGGELVLDKRHPLSYGRELLSILAGPAANLLTALVTARLGRGEGAWLITGLSLALGLFNLLPIWPLDGGRMLALLLEAARAGPLWEMGGRICSALCTALLLLAGGAMFLQNSGSYTLFTVALWLTMGLARGEGQRKGKKG